MVSDTEIDMWQGLLEQLERIADALEAVVLNMEKPKFTKQDYEDFAEYGERRE